MTNLEKQLEKAFLDAADQSRDNYSHEPKYVREMLRKQGAVRTAENLIMTNKITEGFIKMWKKKALHLTVEAIVLNPIYRELFTEEILNKARERLEEYKDKPRY